MKARLLKKLRSEGRSMVNVYSVTQTDGVVTGMKYGYNESIYSKLFNFGDTELDLKNKAARIYITSNIDYIRKKYSKYSKKYKLKES